MLAALSAVAPKNPNLPALLLRLRACCAPQGDLGCAGLLGAPRVQPLNDYRLVFMVKKGLDQYLANNNVYAVCGRDYRLYASPLIKFQKACYQLVSGNQWFLSGACLAAVCRFGWSW